MASTSSSSKGPPQRPKKHPPAKEAQSSAPKASNNNGASPAAADPLRGLYSSLLRCRLVQERVLQLCAANEIGARFQVTIGHEAVTVGATVDLDSDDTVVGSHGNLAALIARGVPLKALLEEHGAAASKASMFCQPSFPEDPFNLGTGIALAHSLEHRRRVVVAFCAQEKPPLQVWHEALKSAAVQKLPIIFIIENGVAGESPIPAESPYLEPVSFRARDYGFPGIIVDGNDAVAVWRVAQEAIHRGRNGSGPTLIDCRTDTSRDPLKHMEHYLRTRRLWDEHWRARLEDALLTTIEESLATRGTATTPAEIRSRVR